MEKLTIQKVNELPGLNNINPNTIYFLKNENGFKTFFSDMLGENLYSQNLENEILKQITLDDVNSNVAANVIHIKVKALENISRGQLVKISSFNSSIDSFEILPCSTGDITFGISKDNIIANTIGSIIVYGVLKGLDTSAFELNDIVYSKNGQITNVLPFIDTYQKIGKVLKKDSIDGILFISIEQPQVTNWLYLTMFFDGTPQELEEITNEGDVGKVYKYSRGSIDYFRFVPNEYNSSKDSFYKTFTNSILSNLITKRT
jgi:hypothetical protein